MAPAFGRLAIPQLRALFPLAFAITVGHADKYANDLYCHTATNEATGDPCQANNQCASGSCNGWCEKACASDADCDNATYCVATNQGNICFPWCGGMGNILVYCPVYGAGVTCKAVTTVSGLNTVVCSG